ncbi:uncharacterized protein LOC103511064, partial [Diaphorina citri]|uniref:Uncharacterized protein LOC103511064 n=1 Tax=Diaphorina citri TaxID=121845 RepID=A0A3Q0IWW0_DIACI
FSSVTETQNTSSFIDTIYNSIANSSDFASETIYDNFPIPDTILADPDLHDHDLIDNVMYVYFGPSQPDQPDAGRQIVIVGAVGGLVAQLLVLSGIICKLKSHQSCFVLINLEVALVASNLLYMLGVQSTRSTDSCSAVALSLHYLHIVTGVWLLFYTYFSSKQRPPIHYTLFTWLSPLPFTLTLYLWDKSMYETRHFCFLNIQRGLFFTFFCPVTILLIGGVHGKFFLLLDCASNIFLTHDAPRYFFFQSTRSTDSCSAVALSLHYLHIVTGVWLLFYTYFSSKQRPPIHYTLFTWLSPLPFTLTLYLWDKSMYETRHFCFLNIQRGLFFTFFCPVTILLIVNTVLCVVTSLKISSLGLPFLFSFDWLFSILSLDTSKSLLFSVIYVGLNILL